MTHRKCECLFFIPMQCVDSLFGNTLIYSKMFCQFCNASGNTSHGKNSVRTSVPRILLVSCPSTIARFIVAILVWPAVKLKLWGTFAHVSQKVFKHFPSHANGDASAAVKRPFFTIRIGASFNHFAPTSICSGILIPSSVTMAQLSARSTFCLEASARLGKSTQQRKIGDKFDSSAGTPAKTLRMTVFRSRSVLDHNKSSVDFFGMAEFSFRHSIGSFFAVFSGGVRPQPNVVAILSC